MKKYIKKGFYLAESHDADEENRINYLMFISKIMVLG